MAKKTESNLPTIPEAYFTPEDIDLLGQLAEAGIRRSKSALLVSREVHRLLQKIIGVQQLLDDIRLAPDRAKAEAASRREALKVNTEDVERAKLVSRGESSSMKIPKGVH